MEAVERKLKNISESQVAISDRPPSLNEMSAGKYLRLYIRVGSKLYYSSFTPVEENNNTWKNLD